MKITTWNVRGITALNKGRMLKQHMAKLACDIIMLQEAKCSKEEGDMFIRYYKDWSGFFQPAVGRAGGLGLLWKSASVVRDETGKMIFSLCGHLGVATNSEAEVMELARGLKQCSDLALNLILIEGDSRILINAIKNESTPNWKIRQILKDILTLLDNILNYKVSHIFREANRVVDHMANLGATLRDKEEQIFYDIPHG
ncbi:uncharacterized protein LOC131859366 [Cryptomeria japonica]|uniref:uncharacterized protein LOC131859366 n=1 Tax=Cryptomeria japonica TaxID=3369 RepID=UPI0027DA859C|nr:uncharacterized protein LOC131859366 [Cryptomeria japonica]